MKYSEDYKRQAVAAFDAARKAGANVATAARQCGHASGQISMWRDQLTESDANAGERHVAKKRPCLRCGRGFRSTWAGNRVCDRCKGNDAHDGLPAGFAETPTEYVGH